MTQVLTYLCSALILDLLCLHFRQSMELILVDIILDHLARLSIPSTTSMPFVNRSVFHTDIDTLIDNIKKRFSDEVVKLLVAFSIFNPTQLPAASTSLSSYGLDEITTLANFYGNEASVKFQGITYTSPPLLSRDDLLSEWNVFRTALYKEKELLISIDKSASPTFQDIISTMQKSEAYKGIFPNTFSLLQILNCR